MIEKELFFKYNINYKYLFDITINNNSEILKIIDELKDYIQGYWKNDKRKDIIQFKIKDAPLEIFKDGNVPLKLKIKMINNNDYLIKYEIKIRLLNRLLNIISKIINTKFYFELININFKSTQITVKYQIKTLLPDEINNKIEIFIENKLNKFIKKIDNYLLELANKINNGGNLENC